MNLSEKDVNRFYHIWLTLLDCTNEKYKIVPKIEDLAHSTSIIAEDISPIRDRLWQDDSIIEDVIVSNSPQFSDADLSIVQSWKNRVTNKFILLKHLKNYSVFLSDNHIYGVNGLVSPLEEIFPSFALPLMIQTTLLPFEGKIIYDSLLMTYPISFGGGAKKDFLEQYREFKGRSGIVTSLD